MKPTPTTQPATPGHTPGPWKAVKHDHALRGMMSYVRGETTPGRSVVIADCGLDIQSAPTRAECEANAHLIAASPAYYAAAEQVAEAMASLLAEARETLTEEYPHEMRGVEASLAALAAAHAAAKGRA